MKQIFRRSAVFLIPIFLFFGLFSDARPVFGQELGVIKRFRELSEENKALRERLEKLEKVVGEFQQKQEAKAPAVAAPVQEVAPAPKEAAPAVKKDEKPAVRAKNPLEIYGYVKLDTFHDDSRVDTGNFVRWVSSEAKNTNDEQVGMTTHQTRFGFNLKGPEDKNVKTTGNLEFELYGGGAETKPVLGMRHAFFQLDWMKSDFQILSGQTWDLIQPLNPNLLNYNPAWWAGNIGVRHPQLRLTKGFKTSDRSKLTFAVAAARPVGDVGPYVITDNGLDSQQPIYQGRVAFQFPTFGANSGTIGVSGHVGKDEYDYANTGTHATCDTTSVGLDLSVAVSKVFAFRGEYWKGKNVDQFFGGAGQGTVVSTASGTKTLRYVNASKYDGVFQRLDSIKAQGGWMELTFGPYAKKWRFNLGAGRDDPEDDLLPDGSRTENTSRWLNAVFDFSESVQFGLELSKWETYYKNVKDGTDTRIQSSCIYKF